MLADDLGYGDVEYNGGVAFTPNLNEMANGEHSIRFDRFYSSGPVCSPTRGSLLTGRNHNRYCMWAANTAGRNCKIRDDFFCPARYPLPASELTVAEILKEQGYKTTVIGKWHLGNLASLTSNQSTSNPGDNGFDEWKVTERAVPTATPNCACFNASQCRLGHYSKRGTPPCTNYHATNIDNSSFTTPHPHIIMKDDSQFITDEFSDFLSTSQSDSNDTKPFFAYIPFHAVHVRYIGSPPYEALYNKSLPSKDIDYYATITAMDAAVGRIRALLDLYNISDNTMLWFTSDNGPSLNSPGRTSGLRGRKGTLYEGGIRVPGIIEWPDVIKENKITTHPAVTSDFVPTIMDILGLKNNYPMPKNHQFDGISLLPLLRNETKRDLIGSEARMRNSTIKWAFNIRGDFNNRYTAVITDNEYKLFAVYKRGEIISYELFDLSSDPSESKNIAEGNNNVALSTSLLFSLDQWMTSVKESAERDVACL